MNEQRTGDGAEQVLQSEWQRFLLTKLKFITKKFVGYIPSGIGTRLIPVGRLAG